MTDSQTVRKRNDFCHRGPLQQRMDASCSCHQDLVVRTVAGIPPRKGQAAGEDGVIN